MPDADFAEVRAALEVRHRFLQLLELEHFIGDRLNFVLVAGAGSGCLPPLFLFSISGGFRLRPRFLSLIKLDHQWPHASIIIFVTP